MNISPKNEYKRQPTILVVEDSDEDFEAFERVMGKLSLSYPIHRCQDGDECVDYLNQARPSLLLLDLNLPGMDGREVLEYMSDSPTLRTIPVVVLTTSTNPQDVQHCYQCGANSYVAKSQNWDQFEMTVRTLFSYWFSAVVLPEEVAALP